MTIGIGFQITDGMFSYANFSWVYSWIEQLRPGWVNILRASQQQEALDAALQIANTTPTRVMVRHRFGPLAQGDENVLHVFRPASDSVPDVKAAANSFYKNVLAQYVGLPLVPVAGNEITLGNYRMYSTFFGEVIRLANTDDMTIAVGRYPTHHPLENTWESLIPLWETMAFYKNAVWSPNVYWQAGEEDGLRKLVRFLHYMDEQVIYRPEVVTGEFGRLRALTDAHDGWQTIPGLSEQGYAAEVMRLWQGIFQPENIQVNMFDVGNWRQTFGVGTEFFKTLRDNIDALQVGDTVPVETLYVTPTRNEGYVNIRSEASITGGDIGDLAAGEFIKVVQGSRADVGLPNRWLGVELAGYPRAFIAAWLVKEYVRPGPDKPVPPQTFEELIQRFNALEAMVLDIDAEKASRVELNTLKERIWSIWLEGLKNFLKLGG